MRKLVPLLLGMILLYAQSSFAQSPVTGQVTDANGLPIPGATIKIKNSRTGTTAGIDGAFKFNVASNATLIVSAVGYETKEVPVAGLSTLAIQLGLDTKAIGEVVVTGTGVATSKRKLGIAVESVSASQLPQAPSNSIDQALVGKIAGAQISSISGNPGDPVNIVLRGINTVQNGTKPLILLDGLEIRSTDIGSLDLSNIERVEVVQGAASATIYGAQGANGVIQLFSKKGKRGQVAVNVTSSYATNEFVNVGKFHKADLHPYLTNSSGELIDNNGTKLFYDPDLGLLSGTNQAEGISYQYGAPGNTGDYRYAILDGKDNINNKPYVGDIHYYDHFKQVFQKGSIYNNSISISGAGEKTDFSIAVSNSHNITPVMKNGYLDRTNLSANVGVELFKGFKIRSTTELIYTKNTMHTGLGGGGGWRFGRGNSLGNVGQVYGFLNTSPFFDLTRRNSDGNYGWYIDQEFLSVNSSNPYYMLEYNNAIDNKIDVIQGFNATYRLNKFVELDAKYGINYRNENARWIFYNQTQNNLYNYNDSWAAGAPGTADGSGDITNWQYNNVFQNAIATAYIRTDFQKDFHMKLPIQTSTQVSFDYRKNKYSEFDNYGISLPLNPPINFSATSSQAVYDDYVEPFITYGYLVNQKIDFSDWAGITAGFRSDWSSAFGGGSKPFTFPHFDGYVNLAGIKFWENGGLKNFIPYFKLRAAYGEAGIQPGAFDRYPVLNTGNLGSSLTYSQQATAKNPDLDVEVSKETEFGADLTLNLNKNGSFLKTLNLSATYWKRNSENVIYTLGAPPSIGATGKLNNAIDMSSKGFQFNLNLPVLQSKDFTWDFTTLFGTQKSFIDHIAGDVEIPLTSGAGSTSEILKGGRQIGQIAGYKTFRDFNVINPATGQPYIDKADQGKYAIVNGTVIDTSTRGIMFTDYKTDIGNATPKFNMSFINSITFKNSLTLAFQFDWVYGSHLYNQTKEWMFRDGIAGDFTKSVSGFPDGRSGAYTAYWASAYYGVWGATRGIGNDATKDFFYEDASFVRLRNISLGYDFANILKIKAVKRAQLVLSGRNIVTFTKYSGQDPEISSGGVNSSFDRGIDHSTLPNTKSYQVSLNLGF
ncbi:MAG: SusC/RagA family TonB-linked outer membrane protein [Bacteroidota bacterium]